MKTKKVTYHFEDISIQVDTQNDTLLRYIEAYSHLTRAGAILEKNVRFNYREEFSDDLVEYNAVPADAGLDLEVPFEMEGVSALKCYSKADQEIWYIYEGYASVRINFAAKEIVVTLSAAAAGLNIEGFLLLFIHPLIRMLRCFGYYRLHAACLKVSVRGQERHILITGLSGRGKSTATFALLKKGYQVLSDEMPIFKQVKDGFQIHALFNMIKLRQSAVDRFFPDFGPIRFRTGEDCYIQLSDLNQTELQRLHQIHCLFILEQTGKTETWIEPISCLDVVPEIFPSSLNVTQHQQTKLDFQSLMELLDSVACYKIFFGTDLDQFAAQIEKLVISGRTGQEETA